MTLQIHTNKLRFSDAGSSMFLSGSKKGPKDLFHQKVFKRRLNHNGSNPLNVAFISSLYLLLFPCGSGGKLKKKNQKTSLYYVNDSLRVISCVPFL